MPTKHPVNVWNGWSRPNNNGSNNNWSSWGNGWGGPKPSPKPSSAPVDNSWSGSGPSNWVLNGWNGDAWSNSHWTGDGWGGSAKTLSPTRAPSKSPTKAPSSSSPTTQLPTYAPSNDPTVKPTDMPSTHPITVTQTPSNSRSEAPSTSRSETPSNSRTEVPSEDQTPSSNPTVRRNPPTIAPSVVPSSNPTVRYPPTIAPSSNPTVSARPTDTININTEPIPTFIATDLTIKTTSCERTCTSEELCIDACAQIGSMWGWSSSEQSETAMPYAGCFYKEGGKCWYGDFGSEEDKAKLFQVDQRERLCCDGLQVGI